MPEALRHKISMAKMSTVQRYPPFLYKQQGKRCTRNSVGFKRKIVNVEIYFEIFWFHSN